MTENIKEKAAFWSIIASMTLTIGKLVAGLLSGSLALMSEAGHALLDTGATLITYFAIKAADKPADDDHHYGHGKIEALAALMRSDSILTTPAIRSMASRKCWLAPSGAASIKVSMVRRPNLNPAIAINSATPSAASVSACLKP